MKTRWIGVGAMLLLGGCVSTETAKFIMTTYPEVPIAEQSSIKIVVKSDELMPLSQSLKEAFEGCGYNVVDEAADYWFILSGGSEYAKGEPQTSTTVTRQATANGSEDVVSTSTMNFASSAMNVSVVAYKTKGLSPLTYFEIPMYTGEKSAEGVQSEDAYEKQFCKDVVERVGNAFLCKETVQEIDDLLPMAANGNLRKLFAESMAKAEAFTKSYPNAQTVDVSFAAFKKKYIEMLTYKFTNEKNETFSFSPRKNVLKEICAAIKDGTYDEKYLPKGIPEDKKISAKERLANWYLYLLVKEIKATTAKDVDKLHEVYADHLMILETIDESGLTKAIPVTLARLEFKLKNFEK